MKILASLLIFLATICCSEIFADDSSAALKKVALVIGNSEYEHASDLDNAINDAELIAETLKDCGFDVVFAENSSIESLLVTIENFHELAETADLRLFFYAGHGIAVDGVSYFLPVDARLEAEAHLQTQAIEFERFLSDFSSGIASSIFILDCCRDNPFKNNGRSWMKKHRSVTSGNGVVGSNYTLPEQSIAFFSANNNQVALDGVGDSKNSPFTSELVKEISKIGITGMRAFEKVQISVPGLTSGKQTPQLKYSSNKPSSTGVSLNTFVFKSGISSQELMDLVAVRDNLREQLSTARNTLDELDARGEIPEILLAYEAKISSLREALSVAERDVKKADKTAASTVAVKKRSDESNRSERSDEDTNTDAKGKPDPIQIPFSAGSLTVNEGESFSVAKLRFLPIKNGIFPMGTSRTDFNTLTSMLRAALPGIIDEELSDETSATVEISKSFWLAETETTIESYLEFLNAYEKTDSGWLRSNHSSSPVTNYEKGTWGMKDGRGNTWGNLKQPMVCVTFFGAKAFCEWLNHQYQNELPEGYQFDLPTEAQWEYACRSGSKGPTHSTDTYRVLTVNQAIGVEKISWYVANSRKSSQAVSQLQANSWGLFDVLGNAREWTADFYDRNLLHRGVNVDPVGAESSAMAPRTVRGGSWASNVVGVRCAHREPMEPQNVSDDLGFRVALRAK